MPTNLQLVCLSIRCQRPHSQDILQTNAYFSFSCQGADEWTFPDGGEAPEGSDRKFLTGTLKPHTFLDVTFDILDQYKKE